jgi:cytochrome b
MSFMPPPTASAVSFPPAPQAPVRRTVDAFTRTLHALLGLSFAGAYITAESEKFRLVHVTLGYTLGGLLLVRLVWGLLGPKHARLSALWRKLRGVGDWLAEARTSLLQSPNAWLATWRQGQNLLLPVSVAVLLLAIAPLVGSGYVLYEELTGDWMEEVHEFMGNLMLVAVLVHVGSVLLLSVLRQRNLAKPMLTGCVPGKGPDLIRRNHRPLAVFLVLAVLMFWGSQWPTGPQAEASAPKDFVQQSKAQWPGRLWDGDDDHDD